ncbi:hypothetical protein [Ignavibacterium sp.]|uniref:hypothetical protein n=1 Tax=Ignavibacterium sp. TaxID=2651167 RepID=UPI0022097FFA|nr:hypothetical protein [Ignavibacterium sp.]BDQ01539.1 MAG: hypothetical protein KatS3mg037_0114 [Ignavibacterium sp.]
MHKIILPYGFSCEIEKGQDFTIYSPKGYFKKIGFPHKFWDSIYEYGSNSGRKWDGNGNPLTENTVKDFYFAIIKQVVGFTSVKQKVEIRKRIIDAFKKFFDSE